MVTEADKVWAFEEAMKRYGNVTSVTVQDIDNGLDVEAWGSVYDPAYDGANVEFLGCFQLSTYSVS